MKDADLCGGLGGCGHPRGEHKRQAGDSRAACTHRLSKSGREITCCCRRFKGTRTPATARA